MKLLVIEDKLTEIEVLRDFLTSLKGLETDFALSRDSALEKLNSKEYDLVILDLQIPPNDGSLEPNVNHGMATLENVQRIQPWASVYFFSAHGTMERVSELLRNNRQEDLFGSGERQAVNRFFQKSQLTECADAIDAYRKNLSALDDILVEEPRPGCLNQDDIRVLKLFARTSKGTRVKSALLAGGRSSAKTLQLSVWDADERIRCVAVGKIDKTEKAQKELNKFNEFVSPLLPVASFVPHISSIHIGARGTGGNFYSLAHQYSKNIYQLLLENETAACRALDKLRSYQHNWLKNARKRQLAVRDYRRLLISDEKFAPYRGLFDKDWLERVESKKFDLIFCPQHSDLHGFNVLIEDESSPLIIDYAEITDNVISYDPLVLELSIWFHPDAQFLRDNVEFPEFEHWSNFDAYKTRCAYAEFSKHCRDWAFNGDDDNRIGGFISAFGFCCKQLKYAEVNKEHAVKVAISAIAGAEIAGF